MIMRLFTKITGNFYDEEIKPKMNGINYETVEKYFDLLHAYGVLATELRVFDSKNLISSEKIKTDDEGLNKLKAFVSGNQLESYTINCTFNQFSLEKLETKNAINDSDITQVKFVFIDIDPIKTNKKGSATDEEVKETGLVLKQVSDFLDEKGIKQQIHLFSGNGYHLLLPIEQTEVDNAKLLNKRLLQLLDKNFTNNKAKIDTSVFNPSRLGKLIGCIANKGENSEQRPHRETTILKYPENGGVNSLKEIEQLLLVTDESPFLTPTAKKDMSVPKVKVRADVKRWLNHYSLEYRVKPGNSKGYLIYIFTKCPLKDHTNNSNGSSLIVNPSGYIDFKCLHDSHKESKIDSFLKRYPLLDEMNLDVVTEEKLRDGSEFRFSKFQLTSEGLFVMSDEKSVKICSPLFIKKTFIEEDTNLMSYDFCYRIHGKWKSEIVNADILQTNRLKHFISSHGIEMLSRFEGEVCDYLVNQKSSIKPKIYHQKVGFSLKNGKLRYLLDESILGDSDYQDKTFLKDTHYFDLSEMNPVDWKNKVGNLLGRGPVDLALSIGLIPCLIGFMSQQKIKPMTVPNIIVLFKGKTTTGKTTMARLIASMYGNPESLQLTMNATSNALMKLASISNGVAFIADELGAAQSSLNMDQLIFSLSDGREKLRLNKDITMDKPDSFNTGIILTSENSLNDSLSQTPGLNVRYLEFGDIGWTKDAEESEFINEFISNSYGGLIREVTKTLIDHQEEMVDSFFEFREYLNSRIKSKHALTSRIVANLALIKMGSALLEKIFGDKINHSFIDTELIKVYELMIDLADQPTASVYDRVVEVLLLNAHRFVEDTSLFSSNKSCIGRVKLSNGNLQVNVFKQTFEGLLLHMGIKDKKTALNELYNSGKLNTNPDRKTKRLTVNSQAVPTYEIILPSSAKSYFSLGNGYYSGISNVNQNSVNQGIVKSEIISESELF